MTPDHALMAEILEAIQGGLTLLDHEGRILLWNAWLVEASGIEAGRARGRTLNELFPNLSDTRLPAAIADAVDLGISSSLSYTLNPNLLHLRRRDGRDLAHNVVVRPIQRGGKPFALVHLIDTTASHDRERVLRDRLNARFNAVVDGAFDAILTTDADGRIQWMNEAAVRQFGHALVEATGHRIDLLLPGAPDLARLDRPIEVEGRRRDGEPVPLEVSAAPWFNGGHRHLTLILRDLTEAKRAEGALRAAAAVSSGTNDAELLAALVRELASGLGMEHAHIAVLESGGGGALSVQAVWSGGRLGDPLDYQTQVMPCGIALAEGRCVVAANVQSAFPLDPTLVTRNFDSYVGVRFLDAQGQPMGVVCAMDPKPLANQALAERLVTAFAARVGGELARQRAEAELRALNVDLERRVEDRTSALAHATEVLKTEMQQREAAQAALAQSQKLEALGQLVGGVAHDFNNMLAAITGSYNLIERRLGDPALRDIVAHGRRAADRAAELVRHLLAFARREDLSPTVVDLATLIADVSDLLAHAAGSQVEFDLEVAPDTWPVLVDRHRLEVALLNLVVNARDAMPAGGRIRVEAKRATSSDTHPPQSTSGECSIISVQDSGTGMSAEVLARAVEPFFTTKGVGKGTGLGLAMVHGFMEQSGGRMTVASHPGEGTTISLVLPRAQGEARQEPRASGKAVPLAPPNTVLLVVDDDDQVRPVTTAYLRDLGYEVLEASTGDEALSIAQGALRLDMLLSDVVMPDMDGPNLASHLRTRYPGLPVLFMTGHADPQILRGETVLGKPFSGEELGTKIHEVLRRSEERRRGALSEAG